MRTSEAFTYWAAEINAIAHEAVGVERCGMLYEDGIVEVKNVHGHPEHNYTMDRDAQLAALAARGWPLALWHTHPSGDTTPSDGDKRMSAISTLPNVIANGAGTVDMWDDDILAATWNGNGDQE